jgi:ATP-dependent exoDNAse (exonuclease V) beta subunit
MLVEGQVDLWGRADDGRLWIADYKTGSPEFVEKAMTQMTLYALALHKAGLVRDGEEIHLAAVYPFAQKVLVEKATSSVGIQAIANSTSRLPRL